MLQALTSRRAAGVWIGLLILAAVPACAGRHDIPKGAIPPPAGTYDCQWNNAEMARAGRDQFVIYQYEWQRGKPVLNDFGQRHLARIAEQFACAPYPVAVEPSADNRLDETRREAILKGIALHGVEATSDRVVLGHSEAEGLYGLEAQGVAQGMISSRTNTANAGGTSGVGLSIGGGQGGGAVGGMGVY
jgi:hypothetical protein